MLVMVTSGPLRGRIVRLDAAGLSADVVARLEPLPVHALPQQGADNPPQPGSRFNQLGARRAAASPTTTRAPSYVQRIQRHVPAEQSDTLGQGSDPDRDALDQADDQQNRAVIEPQDASPRLSLPDASRRDAIVRRSVAPILLASVLQEPQQSSLPVAAAEDVPGRPAPRLWRWMPVILLGVLLLVILSHAALYLRTQDSIHSLGTELTRIAQATAGRDPRADQELLGAIERQIKTGVASERAAMLQEIASIVASQQQSQLASLDAQLQSRLQAQQRAMEQKLAARFGDTVQSGPVEASAGPMPHASPTGRSPAMMDRAQAIFFIDASCGLEAMLGVVREEIDREMVRLGTQAPVQVMYLDPNQRLVEFAAQNLEQVLSNPAMAVDVNSSLRRRGELIDHGTMELPEALVLALSSGPQQLYVLSDSLGKRGDLDRRETVRRLAAANRGGQVRIHAIQFGSLDGRDMLRSIARQNRGSYSFVSAASGRQPGG
ncbi:hypothetical protein [Fontivita pretiosa]|uniref:hypothetical protein n=1 Tax=Fontivita pretiosa TaxID=2989684 RepID=UPI003D1745C0